MKRIITLLLATVALTLVTSCFPSGIRGDGVIKTEDRTITDFSKVNVTGAYDVTWTNGKPALTISTDQNLLPLIETVVDGDTLRIESKQNQSLSPTKGIKIVISSAGLAGVNLTGANNFKGTQITGQNLNLMATGASNITVDGSVTNLDVNLTGANHLDSKSLSAQAATVSMVGASEANITVTDSLKSSITGACILNYGGHPKSISNNVTGPGLIQSRP
jgi:uncharacterized protein YjbI with pentapeptide repeats